MAITSNCAEIIITNPQGSVSFNKLITTTELSPAKTVDSEDRVYLIQNSENVPQTFWWNLEKAIADGYADLEELYDYFVAEIANQCGGGGGGGTWGSITGILSNQTDLQTALNGKVDENAAITGATKTKITYDSKGLVTSGADATTADIADSTNKRYVTDANLVVIGNTSGTNTGDNATNSQYSGLAASKQDTLVSGTNIKTINSNSLLGSGDLVITAGDGNDDFMLVASFKSLYNY
mgnify:CR=1 FL=1